jgi:hypothetical protein
LTVTAIRNAIAITVAICSIRYAVPIMIGRAAPVV